MNNTIDSAAVVALGKNMIETTPIVQHTNLLLATEEANTHAAQSLRTGMYSAKVREVTQTLLNNPTLPPCKVWFNAFTDESPLHTKDVANIKRAMKHLLIKQYILYGRSDVFDNFDEWEKLFIHVDDEAIQAIYAELEEFYTYFLQQGAMSILSAMNDVDEDI